MRHKLPIVVYPLSGYLDRLGTLNTLRIKTEKGNAYTKQYKMRAHIRRKMLAMRRTNFDGSRVE